MPPTADETAALDVLAALDDGAAQRLLARLALLRAYVRHRDAHHLSDRQAQEDVAEMVAGRMADGLDPWVYDVYDTVSGRTLRRWEERLAEGGLAGLSDDHGQRSARSYASYFDPGTEMRRRALYFLADHPGCTSTELLNDLGRHFSEDELPDRRTVQRFLQKFGG